MSSNRNLDTLLLVMVQLLFLTGTTCIENVALHRAAQQKSTRFQEDPHYYNSAWFAVDGKGRDNTKPEEGCASTANGTDKDAWWMVNLQRLYVIVNITVLGREYSYERLRDFYIRVGNSSDISQHVFCTYKSGWVGLRVRETFRCNKTLVGSWVSIQRTNDKGFNDQEGHGWLQLCEVQVYGYEKRTCGHRHFGPACQNICHCAKNWDCDKETGVCPEGACDVEYGGNTCSILLSTLSRRQETRARPVDNTNTVWFIFYQFKKGPYVSLDIGDGPVGEYSVDVKEEGSNDWVQKVTFQHDDTKDRLNVTVTGLKYYRQYTMTVVPWYKRGDVIIKGRSQSTLTVRTSCGKPEKPVITYITAKRVPGGANMTVRYKMSNDGHNCRRYKKVDIRRRLLETPDAPWTEFDWFHLEERRVQVIINMMKKHEIQVKVYNDEDKSTESDIKIFTPKTVPESTTPPTQTSSSETTETPSTIVHGAHSSTDISVTYTSSMINNTRTRGTMEPTLDIGIIVGPVVAAVVLIILIIVFVVLYVRKRKRKAIYDEPHFVKATLQENKEGAQNNSLGNAEVFNPYANLFDEVDARHVVNKSAQTSPSVKGSATDTHSSTDNNPAKTNTVKAISQTTSLPVIASVISPASSPSGDDIEKEDDCTPELPKKEIKAKKTGIVFAKRDSKDYVIPISQFPQIVADKKQKAAFKDEHKSINDASQSINEGSKPENLNKNKYRNIRAYDHSRVILKKLDDDIHSDYINANYIDGNKKAKAYIAAQGPKEDTVDDFWRMVWEVNANIIVMLTKVVENAKSKTMQYWPEAKGSEASVRFGEIDITLDDEQGLADNVTHTLSVTHKGETRRVYHLHFTSWPDKGIPRQAASLLKFRKKVRTYDDKAVGPTIVHCSAGVGRTGTYIALDMLLEQVEEKDEVNIFQTVEKLREQRMNMVQTQGQYIFLHDALIEYLYSVDTSITTPLFKEEYLARLQVNQETGKTKLQEEFSNLAELRVPPAQERCEGLMPENKKKNREKLIVPANTARPYLMTHVQGRNNYINAVFVDGLVERDMFLVTQHPLPDTVVDFWRMIFDYKCQTIVMLNQTNEKEVPYWPVAGDTEMNIGPFNVEISKLDQSNPAYLIRTMVLKTSNGDKPFEIRQFQLLGWSNKEELPPSIPDLISLVYSVSAWHKKTLKGKVKKNIIVHCLNGNKKSGLFCVVYSVLDQIRFNQDVDVFRAVQVARENRYQFITSTEQYKFCFDVALEFLSQFDTYANFDDQTVKKQQH